MFRTISFIYFPVLPYGFWVFRKDKEYRPSAVFFADGLLPLAAVLVLVFLLVLLFLSGISLILLVVHGISSKMILTVSPQE